MTKNKTAPKLPDVPKNVTLTRSTTPRKGSSVVFLIPGVRASVKIARSAFVGEPPATLEIVGPSPFAPPVVQLTKEERKAARAAMTPAMKLEKERAQLVRKQARIVKLEAALGASA